MTPVCLPWRTSDPGHSLLGGQRALIAGWGRVTNNLTEAGANYREFSAAVSILQKLDLPVLSARDCSQTYHQFFNMRSHLCAGGEMGDSP